MTPITLAGFYGWLKRVKKLDGLYIDADMMRKLYPEYVEYVRNKPPEELSTPRKKRSRKPRE